MSIRKAIIIQNYAKGMGKLLKTIKGYNGFGIFKTVAVYLGCCNLFHIQSKIKNII